MTHLPSTWENPFARKLTDREIDTAIAVPGRPINDIASRSPVAAGNALELAMKEVFVPSTQIYDCLRMLQAAAETSWTHRYPDEISFIRAINATDSELALYATPLAPICITGLSGVGKSCIASAFARLFPPASRVVSNHGEWKITNHWRLTIKSTVGVGSLVSENFRRPQTPSRRIPFVSIQRELCQQGVSLLIADELQFLTQGTGNVAPAKLLGHLSRLGPAFAYVSNHILLHKLLLRPQEERQRLLSKPYFIYPEAFGSDDWYDFLRGISLVAPELVHLADHDLADDVHRYTFGMRRLAVSLIVLAYLLMRKRNVRIVERIDLESAYMSYAFSSSRSDVQALLSALPKSEMRKDLWCPLEGADVPATRPSVMPHPAIAEFEQRQAEAALRQQLTEAETKAVNDLTASPSSHKPQRAPRKPKPTASDLLASTEKVLSK